MGESWLDNNPPFFAWLRVYGMRKAYLESVQMLTVKTWQMAKTGGRY